MAESNQVVAKVTQGFARYQGVYRRPGHCRNSEVVRLRERLLGE